MQATAEKQIEVTTLAPSKDTPPPSPTGSESSAGSDKSAALQKRDRIVKRAAKEIKDGFHVNLGVGMPTLVTEHLEPGVRVWLQSENGILGASRCVLVYESGYLKQCHRNGSIPDEGATGRVSLYLRVIHSAIG